MYGDGENFTGMGLIFFTVSLSSIYIHLLTTKGRFYDC